MNETETGPAFRGRAISAAIRTGRLSSESAPLAAFVDLDGLEANVQALGRAFSRALPPGTPVLHAFAVKAHSEIPMLRELHDMGMGCEVASEGELAQALAAGVPPHMIVFDSPAKSRSELVWAISAGVSVNADSFQELDRITEILSSAEERTADSCNPAVPGEARGSVFGVRINPQSGLGAIAAMSTAGKHSKFGIPLRDSGNRERLVSAFLNRPWLSRVHAHVGSQGVPVALAADGIAAIVEFADEVNRRAKRSQVTSIDIGGGISVDFSREDPFTDWDGYVKELRERVPRLFSGEFGIITEFGRGVLAKFGWIAAFVEYTKVADGRAIAITHAGAQVATRTTFMPEAWPIRVEARDPQGALLTGAPVMSDIAGPCCFAGDLVASERPLPPITPGDIVTLLDTGAYYASTGFRYNSLLEPGIYGIRRCGDELNFSTIRAPETLETLLTRTPLSSQEKGQS